MNVVGHEKNKQRFSRAIERDRLPSTFLFVGPEGIGKRRFAIELAKSLLCETPTSQPLIACGHCESCLMVDSSNHPDFELISRRENKSELTIDQFIGDLKNRNREGLCYNFSLKPNRGKRKIAVIDDADYFNKESANCLLKILEEPPPRSVLIMIGTGVDKVLPTIRSRSQIFHFDPLTHEQILTILRDIEIPDMEISREEIAAHCGGSLKGLERYLEEGLLDFRNVFYRKLASCEPISDGFPKELSGFVEEAGKEPARRRNRIRLLADFAIEFYGNISRRLCGLESELHPSVQSIVEQAAQKWPSTAESATDCVERCLDIHVQLAANANQSTLIESWLSDLGKLSRGDDSYANIQAKWNY